MKQLQLLPGETIPEKKRKSILKPNSSKRLRASYGIYVPVPKDGSGNEMRIGTLRVLQRADGMYLVWDEDSKLNEGVLLESWDKWEAWDALKRIAKNR